MNQLRTMRIRSTRCAIGSAGDDEVGPDMVNYRLIYRISITYLSTIVK
jgi:hypothetical protein